MQLIYVHKKHVQGINNKNNNNTKSNGERKCSPKVNTDENSLSKVEILDKIFYKSSKQSKFLFTRLTRLHFLKH